MAKPIDQSRRRGFTLLELLLAIALVAIVAGMVLRLKQDMESAGRTIESLTISPDAGYVVGAFNDGSVQAWATNDGRNLTSLPPPGRYAGAIAISSDGRMTARASYPPTNAPPDAPREINICEVLTGKSISTITSDGTTGPMAFSPDGKTMALVDMDGGRLLMIDLVDSMLPETVLAPFNPNVKTTWGEQFETVAFSHSGNELYTSTSAQMFTKWELATGASKQIPIPPSNVPVSLVSLLAVSPDGGRLLIARTIVGRNPDNEIQLLDTTKMTQLAQATSQGYSYGKSAVYLKGGKSIAVLVGDTIEYFDADTLSHEKTVSLEAAGTALAANGNGKLLAFASFDSIYLDDGTGLQKFVEYRSTRKILPLGVALAITFIVFAVVRQRRKNRICEQCGKQWLPVDKSLSLRCHDCRLMNSTTEDVANHVRTQTHVMWRGLIILGITSGLGIGVLVFAKISMGDFWNGQARVLLLPGVFLLLFVGLVVVKVRFRTFGLQRYRKPGFSLAAARPAACSEGRIDEFGPITLWTDSNLPLAIAVESLAEELNDCRQRFEELTGTGAAPVRPLKLMVFSTTAAANRFVPGILNNTDQSMAYLGKWADVAYLSLEMLRLRLTPLRTAMRTLLMMHSIPVRRGMQWLWLRVGLNTFVANDKEPEQRDAWRRMIAVWSREGSFIPLEKLFKQWLKMHLRSSSAALLPENYESMLKVNGQLCSLVDYLCGPEATPQRRQQFKTLWQTILKTRSIERACQAAFGHGLAELDRDWQAWAREAPFGPPTDAPPEILKIAQQEVIPLACDSTSPLQERIKRIRSLAACGWSVAIEPLMRLFDDPQEDIQRETRRGLELLMGGKDSRDRMPQTAADCRTRCSKQGEVN